MLGGLAAPGIPSSPTGHTYLEGIVPNGPEHITEEDLGSEGIAMVDDRLLVRPIPAVKLQAAAAFAQGPASRHAARTLQVPSWIPPTHPPKASLDRTECKLQCCWAQ